MPLITQRDSGKVLAMVGADTFVQANLPGANLTGANLTGAILAYVVLDMKEEA